MQRMTAASATIVQRSGNYSNFFPMENRNLFRHAIAWTVAWWFFAKIIPIFVDVFLALGWGVSTLGAILDGMSHYATVCGPWLVPICLIMDCAMSVVAH